MTREQIMAELMKAKDEDGRVQPELIVAQAEPPTAPLHSRFEWDDGAAGHQWRLQQARQLIAVNVVYEASGDRSTISLSIDRADGGGYRDTEEVMARPDHRAIAVGDALRELESWQRRYHRYSELAPVFRAIDKLLRGRMLKDAAD